MAILIQNHQNERVKLKNLQIFVEIRLIFLYKTFSMNFSCIGNDHKSVGINIIYQLFQLHNFLLFTTQKMIVFS